MLSVAGKRAAALAALVAAAALGVQAPALASDYDTEAPGSGGGSYSAGVEGQEVSVQVQSTSVNEGSGDSLGAVDVGLGTQVSAHPPCWWQPGLSGRQMAENIKRGDYDALLADGTTRSDTDKHFEGWASHKDDDQGKWWHAVCSSEYFEGSDEDFLKLSEEFRAGGSVRFIPGGGQPPAPPVPGQVVAQAVRRALRVPAPAISTNPAIGPSSATVVGVPTWVWATPATVRTATVTATAGATTATVTITATGLAISAPDATTSCTGWGQPWDPATSQEGGTDCAITFNRSSAHLGGTTPLSVSTTYHITWSATDGASGALEDLTTTTTTPITVAEIQTTNKPTK